MNVLNAEFRTLSFSNGEYYYSCNITKQKINEDAPLKIIGNHIFGKTNENVVNVWINNCTVTRIPKGLTKIFPNMKIFEIRNSKLATIDKNDLDEYKSLEKFCCIEHPISYLSGDLFEDFINLEWIEFWGNNLQIIEPNILDGLKKLKYVEFSRGSPHDKRFSMYSRLSSNASIQEIKDELAAKYSQSYVQKLNDLVNQLNHENKKLKEESEKQEAEKLIPTIQPESELISDLKNFLQNEKHKDFTVKIIDEEFHVHKFLLAARSPTLADIFLKSPDAENLNLVDISSSTFKHILNYIYTDEIPKDKNVNYLDLFAVTSRLKIKAFQDFAAKQISAKITADNVLDIFELSVKYEHAVLKRDTFEEIKKKYSKFQLKDELLLQPSKLKKIIESLRKKEEEMRKFEKEFEMLVMED